MSARNPFREPRPERTPYVTYFICALSAALCMGWWATGAKSNTWGHMSAERIWSGEWGGLITSTFLHAEPWINPFHLIFNLLWMVRLGAVAERVLGRLEFAVFCGLAALVSTGAELALSSHDSVGLSGVVYALFGLAWAGRRTITAFEAVAARDTVNYMVGWFFLCIVLSAAGTWNVANYAHGAGLIFGGAVGWLFLANPIPVRYKAAGAAALAVLVTLTVLSVSYLPWSARWQQWRASGGVTAAAAAPVEEEQTAFNVMLLAAGDKKIQVIKVVREITGLGLKEAKEVVDSAPKAVKEGVSKDEADKFKAMLEAEGASVELK